MHSALGLIVIIGFGAMGIELLWRWLMGLDR